MRGVLGTLGQLKRAQAQGHLPSGGDWAQLGGFLQLSSLSTAAARQTEIKKRFTQLTDYLAQPPATQAGDASSSDPLVQTSEAAQADSGDAHSESDAPIAFSRERFDKDMELPYWTEYYKKVGRQGDDLSSLLSNLQKQGIEVEESNDAGLSEIRDKSGKVTGYKINYGSKTKKWEMLEEYSHWRVRYGWKKSEIQALEQELKKSYLSPTGIKSRRHNYKRAAEEIIVKRHLLETAESLSEPERIVLEKAINQLYKYGLRYGY